jgi:urease accessory protein
MHQRLAEPPVTLERVAGTGRVAVTASEGITRLETLYQEGAAKIRLPTRPAGRGAEAVLINTAGGLTGGDRMAWTAEAGPGATLTLTTPACEKNYRAASGHAEVAVSLAAGDSATLAWLPQETILFDRAALHRTLTLDLAETATALIVEPVILGRAAMGETVKVLDFRDRWRITRGGALIHAEDFRLGPDASGQIARPAVLGGRRAFATVLLLAPHAEDRLDAVRSVLRDQGGASAWNGKLLARLSAETGQALRQTLVPLAELLIGEAALPRLWSI